MRIVITILAILICLGLNAQVPTGTDLKPTYAKPLDDRHAIPSLADTTAITPYFDGQWTYVENIKTLYYYKDRWCEFDGGAVFTIYKNDGTIDVEGTRTVMMEFGDTLFIDGDGVLRHDGKVILEDYGEGGIVGQEEYFLGVDTAGNVVDVDPGDYTFAYWVQTESPSTDWFFEAEAIDENIGYAFSGYGTVTPWKTTDSGRTWSDQTDIEVGVNATHLFHVDENFGFMCGDVGECWKTTDGWTTRS